MIPPTAAIIRRAALRLRTGGLVAFPTETVYGLGADAANDGAVAAVYAAKGRPRFNPLIVHVLDLAAAQRYAALSVLAQTLAAHFWPGPLTLVAPLRPDAGLSPLVTAGLPTVAVRVPAHPVARRLLRAFGGAVAAPSANRSGGLSPTEAGHVWAGLGAAAGMVLEGGRCAIGVESAIVDVSGPTPRLLRPGGAPLEALETALGGALLQEAGAGREAPLNTQDGQGMQEPVVAPIAPGMTRSHYAPNRPLRRDALAPRPGEAWLGFGPGCPGAVANLSPRGDLAEAAAALFRLLHLLDAPPYRGIAVAPVPRVGLGVAINDRLRRAAAAETGS